MTLKLLFPSSHLFLTILQDYLAQQRRGTGIWPPPPPKPRFEARPFSAAGERQRLAREAQARETERLRREKEEADERAREEADRKRTAAHQTRMAAIEAERQDRERKHLAKLEAARKARAERLQLEESLRSARIAQKDAAVAAFEREQQQSFLVTRTRSPTATRREPVAERLTHLDRDQRMRDFERRVSSQVLIYYFPFILIFFSLIIFDRSSSNPHRQKSEMRLIGWRATRRSSKNVSVNRVLAPMNARPYRWLTRKKSVN
jgi:hypothetical protein